MQIIRAKTALTPNGWEEDVTVVVGADGRIAKVGKGEGDPVDILLPAPVNAHSHGFQRAMAGLTEARGPDQRDSFWTWRRLLYRFLDKLTPDHVEAITAFAQMEMLEAGYGASVEFHYLHHKPDGSRYDNIAEMSVRVAAAAQTSGVGLTLMPVLYRYGGCDFRDLGKGQIRFGNNWDKFNRLHDKAKAAMINLPEDTVIGVAPHSLRAVGEWYLRRLSGDFSTGPIHMHLAEQELEVAEVQAHWGARPVEWALNTLPVNERWCMIHCTQMTPEESEALARTGAVVGLCPITESSLGDGIFDGVRFLGAGGSIAVGSDSNIRISLAEELRTLDYSQRLRDKTRAALAAPSLTTGRRLFDEVCAGGARAAGRDSGALAVGKWADMVALDASSVHLASRKGDRLLDGWIFAGDDRVVTDVWSAGRHMVRQGRHIRHTGITATYLETLAELEDAI